MQFCLAFGIALKRGGRQTDRPAQLTTITSALFLKCSQHALFTFYIYAYSYTRQTGDKTWKSVLYRRQSHDSRYLIHGIIKMNYKIINQQRDKKLRT